MISATRRTNRQLASTRDPLSAAVRPCLETLEGRLLMDGEFGSLVARGVEGNDVAQAAAYDRDGNGIVAGSFSGNVDFAPGGVNVFFDSAAGSGYVAKYNTAGSMVWARQVGGGVNDVAVDKHGNVFVTGSFNGTRDFDSTAGTTNLTSAGFEDIFIAKFNSSGSLQWAKKVGGSLSDVGYGIGVDNNGYVYVGGTFGGTVDFNPAPLSAANRTAQLTDGFVLRLTASGGYNRVSQLAGVGSEYVQDIAVDDSGAVYATGRFDKSADFDPAAGSATLMFADATLGGNYDGFVWKLKANGTLGYAKRFGGGLWDEGNGIALDAVGNAYVTGKFTYSAWFNAGSGGTLSAFGDSGSDAFVASYNSEGGFRWTKKMGGGEHDEAGLDIAVDGGRNVYVTGYFRGIANLNPNGWGLVGSAGGTDAFMSVLDTSGNYHHSVSYGGTGNDSGRAIAVDAIRGDVWIGGSFQNTVDFNPKAGVNDAVSHGGSDMYLLRLKRTPSPLEWAFAIGLGASQDEGHFVEVDAHGNVIVAGLLRGFADVDPSAGSAAYGPIGSGGDVFVAKFAPDGTYLWSRVVTHRTNPDWTIGDEKIGGMTVDHNGNIVVVGTFRTDGTTMDFPNTAQDLQSEGGYTDGFIWKLSQNGTHVFAKKFGQENAETANGVAVDTSGNIYVTGTFDYEVEWKPGSTIEAFNYSYVVDHSASDDVWVAKYSSGGTIQWASVSGGEGDDAPTDISVNSATGQVYVVGTFTGEDFRANHMANYSSLVTKTGSTDAFITRYSASTGGANQVLRIGGTGATVATAVDVDGSGNVWIGGDFTLLTDLNPYGGTDNRTSAGSTDGFVVKLNQDGVYQFGRKIGAAGHDTVTDLDTAGGNVYVTGNYQNNVDFNTSALQNATLNGGSGSSFVWQMNGSGGFRSAHKFGRGAASIAIDGDGMAHVVGSITAAGGVDFDPGASTTFQLSGTTQDVLVMKFKPGTTPSIPTLGEAGVFNVDGSIGLSAGGLLDELYSR